MGFSLFLGIFTTLFLPSISFDIINMFKHFKGNGIFECCRYIFYGIDMSERVAKIDEQDVVTCNNNQSCGFTTL